ncbi:nuclear transport factor 2 family protein [Streptomyces sp. GbtcB7]|uniref:nuclear transport factor 2 family protein n=1 Tax=Streptomyces sp. GbtcB7 TaxID=2824752 RepID=UPI001C2FD897|nr:nuclear transport factor 2 family protein [Streptomyces sp. GbtcB7]
MTDDKLRWLVDRTEISETITRYFNALDLRDWPAMRATLYDTLELDFSELFGDPRAVIDSDAFIEFGRPLMGGFRATQHISPNHVITIDGDGDSAEATAYMYAWHAVDAPDGVENTYTLRGSYDISMRRTEDGWRMSRLCMHVWDEAGSKDVFRISRERYDSRHAATS